MRTFVAEITVTSLVLTIFSLISKWHLNTRVFDGQHDSPQGSYD